MSKFAQVKNFVFTKLTKFLSSRKNDVVFLMLIVAWLFLHLNVKKPEDLPPPSVKVKCNDPNINHPMASQAMSSWKSFFVLFGLAWFSALSIGIPLTHEFKRIGRGTTFLKFCDRCLLWIVSIFFGFLFVFIWTTRNSTSETLAPNFLAVCQPHGLDLLCSPDSPLDRVVSVNCTTPPEMWIPALSNSLPLLAAIQAYLMVLTFAICIHYFRWKTIWDKVSGLITQVINVALPVCTGCFIIFCNKANFNTDFVSDYVKSAVVACACIAIDYYWCETGIEDPILPRYWNYVPGYEEVILENEQIPKNPISSRHEPPAATTGTTSGNENNPPPYSKLQPSRNEDLPPDYDKLV
jgi:hypothetical protein